MRVLSARGTKDQLEGATAGQLAARRLGPAVRAAGGLSDVTPHDVKSVQRMLGHASAAMALDVYSGLVDDDLTALADRVDAAAGAAEAARAGARWARPPIETIGEGQTCRSSRWAPWGSNPQPADLAVALNP
jgi:hypothetical protein